MQGFLTLPSPSGFKVFELPRDDISIGGTRQDDIELQGPDLGEGAFGIFWRPDAACWAIRDQGGGLRARVNGHTLEPGSSLALDNGDIIALSEMVLRFDRLPGDMIFEGARRESIPLAEGETVFGRGDGEGADRFVQLDSDDIGLSRRHFVIRSTGRHRYSLADESVAGTLLNGQRFENEDLIVGDRFSAGLYTFEYTGTAVRRVSNSIGAKIEARNIGVTVPSGRQILQKVSLDVTECAFVGILGLSGHGKSTLLNALCGVRPPSEGEVFLNGRKIGAGLDLAIQSAIGIVPQDDIVHRELTVEQAIVYSARLRLPSDTPSDAIDSLVSKSIDRLDLSPFRTQRISSLSGGQRKRVSIATELLSKPPVLFLDEPTSGLDPANEFRLMSILRGLAGIDCTVIATTHDLARADLFDQICFIQKGFLVYDGLAGQAPAHFGVGDLASIYLELDEDESTEEELAEKLNRETDQAQPHAVVPNLVEPDSLASRTLPSPWQTFRTLFKRQTSILRADYLNLLFLLAQPLLIGFLVGWVSDEAVFRMFLAVIATLWFGCSNGAQQIVRELPIYRRERVSGQSRHAYVLSKVCFLSAVTLIQAVILLGSILCWAHLFNPSDFDAQEFASRLRAENGMGPDEGGAFVAFYTGIAGFFDAGANAADTEGTTMQHIIRISLALKLLALFGAAIVGVAIGLTISALVRSETQAVMWVPLVLIPQILFGGYVVTLSEMSPSVRDFSHLVPSFAAQHIMDNAHVYGQRRPLLTNLTRYPQFLSGKREKVEWGDKQSEQFDEASPHNVSWQNLASDFRRLGRHRKAPRGALRGEGVNDLSPDQMEQLLEYNQVYKTSVNQRNDVIFDQGFIYLRLKAGLRGLFSLFVWTGACYAVTIFGLKRKERS